MITEDDILIDGLAEEVFPYLDELRQSGIINMYGASPYIMETFDVNKHTARKLLSAWMDQFRYKKIGFHSYIDRKE